MPQLMERLHHKKSQVKTNVSMSHLPSFLNILALQAQFLRSRGNSVFYASYKKPLLWLLGF